MGDNSFLAVSPAFFSGFLGEWLCLCLSSVWVSLTSYRVHSNPYRKGDILSCDICSLSLSCLSVWRRHIFLLHGSFWVLSEDSLPYAGVPLLRLACSPVSLNQEPWVVKRRRCSKGSRHVRENEEALGVGRLNWQWKEDMELVSTDPISFQLFLDNCTETNIIIFPLYVVEYSLCEN